jgi:hypothetical protein
MSRPKLPRETKRAWAGSLLRVAKKYDFDPFTAVAIIHNESHWNPQAVSRDGEDFGLGQARARYLEGCDSGQPARDDMSSSCMAVKARLMTPSYSIELLGRSINLWRTTCHKATGRKALLKRWLHGYGGMGKLKKGEPTILCGMKKTGHRWRDIPLRPELRRIISYRKMLIRKLTR